MALLSLAEGARNWTADPLTFGDFIATPFIAPDGVDPHNALNNSQLLFLTVVYAIILFQASGLIAEGSEHLLLIPSVAGLVGSIVLPILGAVPDGAMTLFSGIGENAQETVGAGVGVLAGSTVMLLTFPWFLAIYAGKVPLNKDGSPDYKRKEGSGPGAAHGVRVKEEVGSNAKTMILTTSTYFIIQIPATYYEMQFGTVMKANETKVSTVKEAKKECEWALVGLVCSSILFFYYLWQCYKNSQSESGDDKIAETIIAGIKDKQITLGVALQMSSGPPAQGNEPLLEKPNVNLRLLTKIAKPFFDRYDQDKNKTLNRKEFKHLLEDLGEINTQFSGSELADKKFEKFDTSKDGQLQFEEFISCLVEYMTDQESRKKLDTKVEATKLPGRNYIPAVSADAEEDEEEEEEEIPEDLRDLPEDQIKKRIIFRACWKMFFGTFVVLFVSDPFVEVLNSWGERLSIPVFYVSFVVAPFASNASELLSAYVYGAKKTEKGMTTSLSTLIGAACMNNTFVLAIFFALIYVQKLAWHFTAETISIMVIQWLIGAIAMKQVQTFSTACIVLACYPLCLGIVAVLESSTFGLD